jgi:hypothetical protein
MSPEEMATFMKVSARRDECGLGYSELIRKAAGLLGLRYNEESGIITSKQAES